MTCLFCWRFWIWEIRSAKKKERRRLLEAINITLAHSTWRWTFGTCWKQEAQPIFILWSASQSVNQSVPRESTFHVRFQVVEATDTSLWRFSKICPQIIDFNGLFHYKPSHYWESPMTQETPTCGVLYCLSSRSVLLCSALSWSGWTQTQSHEIYPGHFPLKPWWFHGISLLYIGTLHLLKESFVHQSLPIKWLIVYIVYIYIPHGGPWTSINMIQGSFTLIQTHLIVFINLFLTVVGSLIFMPHVMAPPQFDPARHPRS